MRLIYVFHLQFWALALTLAISISLTTLWQINLSHFSNNLKKVQNLMLSVVPTRRYVVGRIVGGKNNSKKPSSTWEYQQMRAKNDSLSDSMSCVKLHWHWGIKHLLKTWKKIQLSRPDSNWIETDRRRKIYLGICVIDGQHLRGNCLILLEVQDLVEITIVVEQFGDLYLN